MSRAVEIRAAVAAGAAARGGRTTRGIEAGGAGCGGGDPAQGGLLKPCSWQKYSSECCSRKRGLRKGRESVAIREAASMLWGLCCVRDLGSRQELQTEQAARPAAALTRQLEMAKTALAAAEARGAEASAAHQESRQQAHKSLPRVHMQSHCSHLPPVDLCC